MLLKHNVSITSNSKINIGHECNIANNVVIIDHDHLVDKDGCKAEVFASPVSIGNKVWIGANSVVTKGTSIGDGCVIAAGGIVTKDIPPHEVWGGVPAHQIRKI